MFFSSLWYIFYNSRADIDDMEMKCKAFLWYKKAPENGAFKLIRG